MSLQWPPKDKDEVLDYSLDWSRALNTGETISSATWSIVNESGEKVSFSNGVTVDGLSSTAQTKTNTITTIYLSQGTNNKQYKLYCAVTTNQGRTHERAVAIKIREYN